MSEQSAVETTIELDPTRPAFGPDERIGDLGRTHFIGIGGAGMSVLAEMLHEQGVVVDGSDREPSPKTDRLQSLGVAVQFGQRAQNREIVGMKNGKSGHEDPLSAPWADGGTLIVSVMHGKAETVRDALSARIAAPAAPSGQKARRTFPPILRPEDPKRTGCPRQQRPT